MRIMGSDEPGLADLELVAALVVLLDVADDLGERQIRILACRCAI
jgi:hypothetical protein